LIFTTQTSDQFPRRSRPCCSTATELTEIEDALIALPSGPSRSVDELAALLAESGGIVSPALSPAIEGAWTLLHTSSSSFDMRNPLGRRIDGSAPGLEGVIGELTGGTAVDVASSSPIQRAVTGAFSVVQTISLTRSEPRVFQEVRIAGVGVLHLNARASTSAETPDRIKFSFDEGYLELSAPAGLRLPYPVPFRLLGKEANGYLDTLYLSERMRISKGNKGTTFILAKK